MHPETYEWARKMAVDALEYDESAEDANPAGALEEILENPERLKDLDLDAFAEELERQVSFILVLIFDSKLACWECFGYKKVYETFRECTVRSHYLTLTHNEQYDL